MANHHSSSRRTFLTAGTAAIVGGSTAGALASAAGAPDPVDALFRRWRAADTRANALGNDDDEGDRLDAITQGIEIEIEAAPASPTKAAALAMLEIRWETGNSNQAPSDYGCGPDSRHLGTAGEDRPIMALWGILECLRPYLSGLVGEVAADYLDHPHRPIGESKLFTFTGEEA